MADHLSTYSKYIVHTGIELISQYGNSALVQADKHISICESEGFNSVAEDWKLIREVIRQIQQSDSTIEGYKKALNKGVILSE